MATIYEVAKLADVSPATVSRVFNGTNVSAAKKAAVLDAAKQLKFSPNRTARTLRRQESELIALVLPDIENPYFTELARGVEDVAQSAGYSVVLCNTDADPEKEARYFQVAISEHMAGVVVAAASENSDFHGILAAGHPVVAVDRGSSFDVDAVMMANRDAGRMAAQSLVDAGYQRIACVTGPAGIETAAERVEGWRAVLRERGLSDGTDELLRFSTFRVNGGREMAAELLSTDNPPDAIVAGNNLLGVGVLQVLSERGLTPPAIGVAVIGSLPFTTLTPDVVTVVRLPARQMGLTAAKMLLERIGGDDQPARTVVLRGRLQAAVLEPTS